MKTITLLGVKVTGRGYAKLKEFTVTVNPKTSAYEISTDILDQTTGYTVDLISAIDKIRSR